MQLKQKRLLQRHEKQRDNPDTKRARSHRQKRSGLFGEKKNLLSLPGFQPRVVQPVAWSLNRLHHHGSYLKDPQQILERLHELRCP